MRGIIVGADGSTYSQHAVEWAIREATFRHVPVTVLTVYQVETSFWSERPGREGPEEKAHAMAVEQTDKALSQLGGIRPSSITIQAVRGIPAEELISAARGADMIVVGARGAGGFAQLLLGSVGTHLTYHAECPVVIIPPEDRYLW